MHEEVFRITNALENSSQPKMEGLLHSILSLHMNILHDFYSFEHSQTFFSLFCPAVHITQQSIYYVQKLRRISAKNIQRKLSVFLLRPNCPPYA